MKFSLFFFIIIPFTELLILLEVADRIGALYTVLLIVVTAALGIHLLKRQGISTLTRFQQRLHSGDIPGQEIVEGMIIAFCGALLLAPGFITDTLALLGLLPAVRAGIAKRILRSGSVFVSGGSFSAGSHVHYGSTQKEDGEIIDGEYRNETTPNPELDDK
ncbi:MAG: FxsA family protein [Gammaproteobacteria bacterium]|nr:FxsA family protein [Gammaproteobacteria bacterium]MDP2140147.1 FxsA family protein [Gammaproteobacteria bacterium]MDP2347133.1 FxsA family protein [Gammaproteobacteria bacterium]